MAISTNNVDFGGKEANSLSWKKLQEVIGLLDDSEPEIHHIFQNCTPKQLESIFGEKKVGTTRDVLFGIPIYEKRWIPHGEVWLIDKSGKVIQRYYEQEKGEK